MATILLSAAGAALGSGFGGTVLGLSGAVIGRAVGAAIGRSLDERLLGGTSDPVQAGKVEAFRLTGANYGEPIAEVWGRMRLSGHVIWASRFKEWSETTSSGGGSGKGSPRPTTVTTTFYYTVSVAIAVCRGPILRVGRVWADGVEIALGSLEHRIYTGSEDQIPDPKIAAVEGIENAPAYRGIAYVVFEDIPLARFGNRVPQFSFEVVKEADKATQGSDKPLSDIVRAVAMIPGTGEYALATTSVHYALGPGKNSSQNVHTVQGDSDFVVSLRQLSEELPKCESVSLVASWFGSDLRCRHCEIRPKVEQKAQDSENMPWEVSNLDRFSAGLVSRNSGRPVYGGTPSDASVVEAIRALRDSGKEVMFYPFILMDQTAGNGLPDPWGLHEEQPPLPWRGRITLDWAPGIAGSSDGTSQAAAEIDDFLGNASPADFAVSGSGVEYSGPDDWGYRRFILHYATLCAAAGGVDAFCIGSEMRSLTMVRSAVEAFPFVDALIELAADVRSILGAGTKISYAADWSEYSGIQSGSDRIFHLDPLWANLNIDFIGIDNYMPISHWGGDRPVVGPGSSVYDLDYLVQNIGGGEGFDWFYESPEAARLDIRTPIKDTAYGEDWVFRYKDIRSWWSNPHHNRIGGVASVLPTNWVPGSKPIRFTEYGCAALDRSTNAPNRFLDPRSSESALPEGSDGTRDDFIQYRYYVAMDAYWNNETNNPRSLVYGGPMVEFERSHAWAWDARPYPEFPGNTNAWSDGANYHTGHWLNGRTTSQSLSSVVSEIFSDVIDQSDLDLRDLHGMVRGYRSDGGESPRARLQTLSVTFGFDFAEVEGRLRVFSKAAAPRFEVEADWLVQGNSEEGGSAWIHTRSGPIARVQLRYYQSDGDFGLETAEAVFPHVEVGDLLETDLPLLLTPGEANAIAERSLSEARVARDHIVLELGPAHFDISNGASVNVGGSWYKVSGQEEGGTLSLEGVGFDPYLLAKGPERGEAKVRTSPTPTTPVFPLFLDLPLIRGDEVVFAPHVAVSANPWPGVVSVWSSPTDNNFRWNVDVSSPAVMGVTLDPLARSRSDLWDRGARVQVRLASGQLSSADMSAVLNGENLALVGDGSSQNYELFQFGNAELVGEDTFELSMLLRGLGGTDATSADIWPAGSIFLLWNPQIPQLDILASSLGLERYYRVGASALGFADDNVVQRREAFLGIGLRPLSVSHLSYSTEGGGDVRFGWIRRSRVGGDSWSASEVPLGEEAEIYSVRVLSGTVVIREETVTNSSWVYDAAERALDGTLGSFDVEVAQISSVFGAGPYERLSVAG